ALASACQPVSLADGRVIFKKIDVQKSAQAHFTTFENLLAQAAEEVRIILEFCSPTSFSHPSEEGLLPLPNLVFTSILEKWNSFSDRKIPDEAGKAFEKIRIDWIRLKTEFVRYSWGKIPGFIGKVIYRLPESMGRETRRWVNALADFTFFSGVGKNTFLGMGQARRKEK
ncbi:MAG: CRISPR system precrRNA processing endoribonuclease RAMP protein Cas6, partial [Candidatus Aminicenantales bacterium]